MVHWLALRAHQRTIDSVLIPTAGGVLPVLVPKLSDADAAAPPAAAEDGVDVGSDVGVLGPTGQTAVGARSVPPEGGAGDGATGAGAVLIVIDDEDEAMMGAGNAPFESAPSSAGPVANKKRQRTQA